MKKFIMISEDDYEDLFNDIEETIEILGYNSFIDDKRDLMDFINYAVKNLSKILNKMEVTLNIQAKF